MKRARIVWLIVALCLVVSGAIMCFASIKSLNYENCSDNLGEFLSDIVSHKLKTQNEDFNWAKVKPLYIQKPSITKPKELKNV